MIAIMDVSKSCATVIDRDQELLKLPYHSIRLSSRTVKFLSPIIKVRDVVVDQRFKHNLERVEVYFESRNNFCTYECLTKSSSILDAIDNFLRPDGIWYEGVQYESMDELLICLQKSEFIVLTREVYIDKISHDVEEFMKT
jgi:hypothetical protein